MRIHALILLAAGALGAASNPRTAPAQEPSSTLPAPHADTLTPRPFVISAQPLSDAIATFREQSSLTVDATAIDSGAFSARSSTALAGTYTAADALRILLRGTGVTATFADERTAVLRPDRTGGAQTLAPIQIVETHRAGYATPTTFSATRTPTPLRDVPQAISIVTKDMIQDLSMQGMADAVRYIPGVTMGQGEGNRDQATIRGNNTTADFFVDGVRDDVQYVRDLYNVERIEALKGSNAMVFGRGGGGGVLNRVTKEAEWGGRREITLQGGSFDNRRASLDVGDGLTSTVAARLNAMVEDSDMFRRDVTVERYGVNPTLTLAPASGRTRVVIGYERFADRRTADRGIPSFNGRPVDTDIATFFGDPDASWADIRSNAATATITHSASGAIAIRNRTSYGSYDKFYQNVFPGAVTAAGDEVSIAAYNNDTRRHNLFNQTDVTLTGRTGSIGHTLLLGAELGRQVTDNERHTGYFNDATTSVLAPLSDPTISIPITFRQSASDSDLRNTSTVASVYVQDQVVLSDHWQVIAGVRYERFALRYHDNRSDLSLRRTDGMISPRAGLIFKPVQAVSLYASHSVSYLPGSGDQFMSLSDVTKALEPERFTNHEIGAKWDATEQLAFTGAVYRLDRTNTRAPSVEDPTRFVQTGSQRMKGFEASAAGRLTPDWEIVGAWANQSAVITSTTTAAQTGARVPFVPRTTLSVWNRYQFFPSLGAGIGVVHRSDMFAALDEKVTVPGYTDVDAALYLGLGRRVRAQAFVENLFDVEYFPTAHNNNNISPGSRRALRVSLTTRF